MLIFTSFLHQLCQCFAKQGRVETPAEGGGHHNFMAVLMALFKAQFLNMSDGLSLWIEHFHIFTFIKQHLPAL